MTLNRSPCTDLNSFVKLLIEHLRARGWTHWSYTMFSLGPDTEYWYTEYGSTIWDFTWNIDWIMDGMCMSEYSALCGFFNFVKFSWIRLLVDANMIMTNPTKVRCPWLMGFRTDWFVWDFHDRQNVSLYQSIRASGLTAQSHYEWGVNLTFHLQYVMRVIRQRGSRIKAALRSCPLRCHCCVTRKPNSEAITGNYFIASFLSLTTGAGVLQCMQDGKMVNAHQER